LKDYAEYLMSREASNLLFTVALPQGGYFTAKQAKAAGYDYPHLDYHVTAGNFVRVDHGLYRLANLPTAEHDDLIRLSLWSRNRADVPQAVASHETALALYDVGEVLPSKIHLTVPPGFRKKPPKGSVLHWAILSPTDIEAREGFQVTTPLRTLLDVAEGELTQEQLDKATADALDRGLVRRDKLLAAISKERRYRRLARALVPRPRTPAKVEG
jgi:predicted transcriptional regulator of viral defense system